VARGWALEPPTFTPSQRALIARLRQRFGRDARGRWHRLHFDHTWTTLTPAECGLYHRALDILEFDLGPYQGIKLKARLVLPKEERHFLVRAQRHYHLRLLTLFRAGLVDSLLVRPWLIREHSFGASVRLHRGTCRLEPGIRTREDPGTITRFAAVIRLCRKGHSLRSAYRTMRARGGLTVTWPAFIRWLHRQRARLA
jgi:hypothetical protein